MAGRRMQRIAGAVVAVGAIGLIAWSSIGIHRQVSDAPRVFAAQAELSARLQAGIPATFQVAGRTVEFVNADIDVFPGGRYSKARMDVQFRLRDQGQEVLLYGREGTVVRDDAAGTAVLGRFLELSYELPGVAPGARHEIPDLPTDRTPEQAEAYALWAGATDQTVGIPLMVWDPSELPDPGSVKEITTSLADKGVTFVYGTATRGDMALYLFSIAGGLLLLGAGASIASMGGRVEDASDVARRHA